MASISEPFIRRPVGTTLLSIGLFLVGVVAYAFLPVAPNFQSPEEIASFAELLASLPKPILAFCRSGTRSGKLYRAATGG